MAIKLPKMTTDKTAHLLLVCWHWSEEFSTFSLTELRAFKGGWSRKKSICGVARLESGAFYETILPVTIYEIIKG
jgi:hypothetical protein